LSESPTYPRTRGGGSMPSMLPAFVIETDLHDGVPSDWHRWRERDFSVTGRSDERGMTPRYETQCLNRLKGVPPEGRGHFRLRNLDTGQLRPCTSS
jgi:hypothetical protein